MTSYRRHDAQVSQQWGHGKKSRKFPELPRGSRTDGRGGGEGSEGRAHCAQSGASYYEVIHLSMHTS